MENDSVLEKEGVASPTTVMVWQIVKSANLMLNQGKFPFSRQKQKQRYHLSFITMSFINQFASNSALQVCSPTNFMKNRISIMSWVLSTSYKSTTKSDMSTSVKLFMFVTGSKKVNFDSNYIDCLVNIKVISNSLKI